jgi:hypothetical protein
MTTEHTVKYIIYDSEDDNIEVYLIAGMQKVCIAIEGNMVILNRAGVSDLVRALQSTSNSIHDEDTFTRV